MYNLRRRRFILTNSFSPLQIPNLALWLDASDAGSITLDGSNNVSQWNDKSGNARNATQATPSNRPSYSSSNQINGINCPHFDATDDNLTTPSFTITQPCTYFIVARSLTSDTSSRTIIDGLTQRQYIGLGSTSFVLFAGTNIWTSFAKPAAGSSFMFTLIYDGASTLPRLNGVNGTVSSSPGTGSLTGGMRIGRFGASVNYGWDGQIAEIIAYQGALNLTQIAAIEAYLKNKWGTP